MKIAKGTPNINLQSGSRVAKHGGAFSISAFLSSNLPYTQVAAPTGVVQFFDSLNGATPSPIGLPQALNTDNGSTLLATIAPLLTPGSHVFKAIAIGDTNRDVANARPITVEVITKSH